MKEKYITVLDFEVGKVFQYKSKNWENSDKYEELITNNGHRLSNCEWMVHEDGQVITRDAEWTRFTN
jgi:hypothetical protein